MAGSYFLPTPLEPDLNDFHLKNTSPCIDSGTHILLVHYEETFITNGADYDREQFTGIDVNGVMVSPSIGADETAVYGV